ncbi:hypothetical protein M758_1G222500 [Ceratodon purpureus]|nr:hypothetical protein M758_1G222500 [Ceratodon purpureus]
MIRAAVETSRGLGRTYVYKNGICTRLTMMKSSSGTITRTPTRLACKNKARCGHYVSAITPRRRCKC